MVFFIIFLLLLLLGLGYFFFRMRRKANPIAFKGQLPPLAAFSLMLILNGLFTGGSILPNLLFGLVLAASFVGFYLLNAAFLPRTEDVRRYFFFTMLVTALMIVGQLLVAYATTVRFDDNLDPIKESIILGWGAWTNIGAYLTLLLPAPFYFAATDEKKPTLWFCLGCLVFGGIVLSGSRASLGFGAVVFLFCLLLLVYKSANKRQNRLCVLVFCLLCLIFCFLFRETLFRFFTLYWKYGFSDNGRFVLWERAFDAFKEAPVFGVGFYDIGLHVEWVGELSLFPPTSHNTILHLLSATGILGLGAYLWHRVKTVQLLWQSRKNTASLFLFISMFALILCSFVDEHLFHIYPAFCYIYALYLSEPSKTL